MKIIIIDRWSVSKSSKESVYLYSPIESIIKVFQPVLFWYIIQEIHVCVCVIFAASYAIDLIGLPPAGLTCQI